MDGWSIKKLSEVCEKITDGTHQTPKYFDQGHIFLSSKNVTSGKIDWNNVRYIDDEQHIAMQKRISPRVGDILLAKNGTTGVAAMVDRDICFDIYVSLAFLRPLEFIEPKLLWYFVNSPIAKDQFNKRLKGIGVPNLHLKEIRDVQFSYPDSIPEQKRIVALLDTLFADLEQTRAKTEQNLKNARELFDSYLQQVFSQQGEGWEDKTLSDVVLFENGDRGKNYPSRSKFVESGIAFINAGHIHDGKVDLSKMNYISKETYDLLGRGKVKDGDVLFCLRGSLGKFALIESDLSGAIASSLVIMRPNKDLSTEFLLHYLRGGLCKNMIEKYAGGAAQPNLGAKDLAKFTISVPEYNEQKTVANKLDILMAKIENLEANYQLKLSSIDELKKSILQKAFSGELTATAEQPEKQGVA